MKAIILAAGFGTRLYPMTRDLPKALLEIGGKTILDHLMKKLEVLSAIDEVVVVTNGRFYQRFLNWQKTAPYSKFIRVLSNGVSDHEKSLGAVRDLFLGLRSGYCGSDDALVFCGDNHFDFPLGYVLLPALGHRESAFVGIYDIKDKALAREYGVVEMDDHHRITKFEEKPQRPDSALVSTAAYFFPRKAVGQVLEYISSQTATDKLGTFISWLVAREPVFAVRFRGRWFDIGDIASYKHAQERFRS